MSLPMREYSVGGEVYEIVDQKSRDNIDEFQIILDKAQTDVEEIKRITSGYSADIEMLKLASVTPDTTLTISGAAADSKVVGDAISSLEERVASLGGDVVDGIGSLDSKYVKLDKIVNNLTTTEAGYILDARQAYELYKLIQKKAESALYTARFSSTGWTSSSPYTQTVYVDGILKTDNPIADVDTSTITNEGSWAQLIETWNTVGRIVTHDGSVTMYCYKDKPTIDMTVFLKVVR